MRRSFQIGASILAGCLLIVGFSATSGHADVPDDAKAIQGTWTPMTAELAGEPMADAVLKTIILKLDSGKYEVSVAGKVDKGTCTLDPTTEPKSLTIQGTDGPNAGKTYPCIYELDGDKLRVCYDLSGKKAPADFSTAKGTLLYLVTYARKKD